MHPHTISLVLSTCPTPVNGMLMSASSVAMPMLNIWKFTCPDNSPSVVNCPTKMRRSSPDTMFSEGSLTTYKAPPVSSFRTTSPPASKLLNQPDSASPMGEGA